MRKRIRILLSVILALIFLFSITMVLRQQRDNANGSSTYEAALEIALSEDTGTVPTQETQPTEAQPIMQWVPAPIEDADEHVQTLEEISLDALREVNPDVLGWILIPNTKVNYPLLQGTDNDYYLGHTWEGKKNSVGSIFLEQQNSPDFTDFNTIVYGHNMKNGSMFGSLRSFGDTRYWESHPYIYIRNDEGVFRYEVFSSYRAEVTGSTYGLSFHQFETRANFLVDALENSKIATGIAPDLTDRILTLSTCSGVGYSTRWVVHARLKMIQQEIA